MVSVLCKYSETTEIKFTSLVLTLFTEKYEEQEVLDTIGKYERKYENPVLEALPCLQTSGHEIALLRNDFLLSPDNRWPLEINRLIAKDGDAGTFVWDRVTARRRQAAGSRRRFDEASKRDFG